MTQLLVLAAPGWWRHWPPVPAPDPAYFRFRLQTAYGDAAHEPDARDVVTYLNWCRSYRAYTCALRQDERDSVDVR